MGGMSPGRYPSVDVLHARMHEGRYFVHVGEITIAPAAIYDHLVIAPAGTYPHLRLLGVESTVTPVRIWLYESPTVTNVGTVHGSNNVKRYSTRTANTVITHAPTITATGSVLLDGHLIPGTNQSGGSGAQSFMEWLLKPTLYYLVRVRNDGNQNATIVFSFEFYEEDHPETEFV